MSSKMGLLLSLMFVMQAFVLAADMISLQTAYSSLDSKAVAIGYLISQQGNLNEDFIEEIEQRYQLTFTCEENCTPRFKDVVKYKVAVEFNPIIIRSETILIEIHRSTVIGYFK